MSRRSEHRGGSNGWPNGYRPLVAFAKGALAAFAWKRRKAARASEYPVRLQDAAAESSALPVFAQNRSEIVYAWRGPSLLVVDNQCRAGGEPRSGYFFREARYLRELRLEIQGESPFPCSLADVAANELEFTYVYPEKEGGGSDRGGERRGVIYGNLDLRLRYRVRPCGLLATLRITNHWQDRVEVDVAWALSADFADMGELHGERRQQAEVEIGAEANGVRFLYSHPELPMATHVFAEGGPVTNAWSYADGRLAARVPLDRQSTVELRLSVLAVDAQDPSAIQPRLLDRRRGLRRLRPRCGEAADQERHLQRRPVFDHRRG
ncbi:MAG TPA: glycogen debranching N-terminal domain-containing protein [Blastocatellia bacterium]|nr:glycogen debranching N-terminal domain-containing protein [Blastocatellia bacterium]